jgi:hypothetical protein
MNSKNCGCWTDLGGRRGGRAENRRFRMAVHLGTTAPPPNRLRVDIMPSPQPCPHRGHPGPRASLEEGGRIPGPLGESVWGALRLSRVKMNGWAALDGRNAPLINRLFLTGKEVCLSTLFYFEATNIISTLFYYEALRFLKAGSTSGLRGGSTSGAAKSSGSTR